MSHLSAHIHQSLSAKSMIVVPQVLLQRAIFHVLCDNIERIAKSAYGIESHQLWMIALLHYVGFTKTVIALKC